MNLDPSSSTQLTPSTGDGPSAAPSTSTQPPPPTSVSSFGTPSSIAQPTPSTSTCPSDDVASSTRKRHRVAPSPPTSPDSAPLTTTHLPPSLRCHLESTPATPIRPNSSILPISLDSTPAAPIHHMASFLPHSVSPTIQSNVDMFTCRQ